MIPCPKFKTQKLTQHFFVVISATFILLVLITALFIQYKTVQYKILEREKDLYIVSNLLSTRLDNSFDEILAAKGALNKPVQEKVLILNSVLQPIINDVFKSYPNIGMGYYSIELDRNLAVQPNFSPSLLVRLPHSRPFFKVYETKKPLLCQVNTSVAYHGRPALIYTSPIFAHGKIIGHTWANMKIDDLYHDFYVAIAQSAVFVLLCSTVLLLLLKKLFNKFDKEIGNFANVLASKPSQIDIDLFPEMAPVYRQIKNHVEKISQLDKLNLVGQIAAAIGHEVRNPMTTVRGFLQLLKGKEERNDYVGYYDLMIEELDRANSIITQFLSLAKNAPEVREIKNLNSVLQTLQPLLTVQALAEDKNIDLSLQDTPNVLINEKEIRQLVLNLVKNALEATPSEGVVRISTYEEAGKVVLAIEDKGDGIKEDIIDKIGTPFLTTKEDGNGLGLATCFSIANKHGATIDFTTGPSGTTFFVRFAAYQGQI